MSNPLMEKMLNLTKFVVMDFKQNDNDMGFYVQKRERLKVCPAYGSSEPELVIYKTRKQTARDINTLGKRSALIIKRHYYECRECEGEKARGVISSVEPIWKFQHYISQTCFRIVL